MSAREAGRRPPAAPASGERARAGTASPFENRSVLVTGGDGFIAHHLLARLARIDGCRVEATRRAHTGDHPDSSGAAASGPAGADDPGVAPRWSTLDLTDSAAVEARILETRPDVIVHLAGYVSGARELDAVLPALRGNLVATVNVLTAASRAGTSRVVLAGSMEEPRDDGSDVVPGSPYAAAKWAASGYARMFHALYGLPVTVLRIFMTYGPAQKDVRKVLPYVILSALRGETPELASGARPVDWIYVEDVVAAIEAACAAPEPAAGRSLDVGSGTLVTIREVVERLVAMIDPDVRPRFGALANRPLEHTTAADTAATRAAIGWSPRVGLEEGLTRTVAWYREREAAKRA
jgi:nucleoside-diphosphate-sugar epimerase